VPDDRLLWSLVKNGHGARAIVRPVPGVGLELRYLWDQDVRQTQVYREAAELEAAAATKRDELLTAGWMPQLPPVWGN
jgi:hypothetical protein